MNVPSSLLACTHQPSLFLFTPIIHIAHFEHTNNTVINKNVNTINIFFHVDIYPLKIVIPKLYENNSFHIGNIIIRDEKVRAKLNLVQLHLILCT